MKSRALTCFALCLGLLGALACSPRSHGLGALPLQDSSAPHSEVRAVWVNVDTICSEDPVTGKKDIRNFVDRFANANFNMILPLVTGEYMRVATEPNNKDFRGIFPRAKWDSLGELVTAAHERGMKVQIWYSLIQKTKWSPEFEPVVGGNPKWAARNIDDLQPDPATGVVRPFIPSNVCPVNPDARQWEVRAIQRMLDRYPLANGIHLEEPGYSRNNFCVCDQCIQKFKELYGADLVAQIATPNATTFRCNNVSNLIKDVHDSIKKRTPKLSISCNSGYRAARERLLGRDWVAWSQHHWIDFYAPQVYTASVPEFEQFTKQVITDVGPSMPIVAGIGVRWVARPGEWVTNSVDTAVQEVAAARRVGAAGVIFYIARDLTDDYLKALRDGPFAKPAKVPDFAQ